MPVSQRVLIEEDPRDNHCAYKLDLSKAYARFDWLFLAKTLLKLGFCKQWTSWVMTCVRSVRFSVRINGHTSDPFTPSRGLRQGDPLSPYLFLFVGEALSCILKNQCMDDDNLLFFKATSEEARAVDSALKLLQRCTG
jgi:hypothetical protein